MVNTAVDIQVITAAHPVLGNTENKIFTITA